jgi:hypothetical protein
VKKSSYVKKTVSMSVDSMVLQSKNIAERQESEDWLSIQVISRATPTLG